jgi:zinc-binding alcohol dehydrogenase family protein
VKAVGYKTKGSANVFLDFETDKPQPRPNDILVRVKAVSVNPVDYKARTYDAPASGEIKILGWDAAGVVEAVGSDVTLFKPGDDVFYAGAIDRPGANAQSHVVDERLVGPKPKSLTFAEAAALPLTSITAWEILFDRMRLPRGESKPGDAILVIAGAGGLGSIFVQLARQLTTDLTVIATASRPETVAFAKHMGAHVVVDHRRPLDQAVREAGFDGVKYVAALTTTSENLPGILNVLKPQGHVSFVDDPVIGILPFKPKSLTVSWEMMFTRSLFQTEDMIEQHNLLSEVSRLVDAGVLRTTLRRHLGSLNAASLAEAHRLLESGRSIGKIVLDGIEG